MIEHSGRLDASHRKWVRMAVPLGTIYPIRGNVGGSYERYRTRVEVADRNLREAWREHGVMERSPLRIVHAETKLLVNRLTQIVFPLRRG